MTVTVMCACQKVCYDSRRDAHRVLDRTEARLVYRCPDGQGWHVTSMTPAQWRAYRKRRREGGRG